MAPEAKSRVERALEPDGQADPCRLHGGFRHLARDISGLLLGSGGNDTGSPSSVMVSLSITFVCTRSQTS